MLVSKKNAESRSKKAFKEGRNSYVSDLKAWHEKQSTLQSELDAEFENSSIEKFSVNIWDDSSEGGITYAYVEMNGAPNSVCFDLLTALYEFSKSNVKINKTGVKFGIRFYDASTVWPSLIGDRNSEFSLYKRWEMTIHGANYESLEVVVKELKRFPQFMGKPVDIYSES